MYEILLRCKDKRFDQSDWQLRLKDDGVQLLDPEGATQAQFPILEAEQRLVVPSFWMSVSDLGVVADDGATIWFLPHPDRVADIKRYRARSVSAQINALAAQGPDAVRKWRLSGWLEVAGGIIVLLLAVTGLVIAVPEIEAGDIWSFLIVRTIVWLVVAAGVSLLILGLITLRRVRRAGDKLHSLD